MENIEILIVLFTIAIFLWAFTNQTVYQSKYSNSQPKPNTQSNIGSDFQLELSNQEQEQDELNEELLDYDFDDQKQIYQPIVLDYVNNQKANQEINQEENDETIEKMAPLSFGTYQNNYSKGSCNAGSFARTDCMIGNCPINSTIADETYCKLQCAQDPDQELRADCEKYCSEMLTNNCD